MKTTSFFIITLIAVTGLSFFGCTNPSTSNEPPQHEHEYVFDRDENTRYDDVVYNNSNSESGDDAWRQVRKARTAAQADSYDDKFLYHEQNQPWNGLAERNGTRTVIVDRVFVCSADDKEKIEVVETPNQPFTEQMEFTHEQEIKDGKVVNRADGSMVSTEIFPDWDDLSVIRTTGKKKNGGDIDFKIVDPVNPGDDGPRIDIDTAYEYTYTEEVRTGDKGTVQTRYVYEGKTKIQGQEQGVVLSTRTPGVTGADAIDTLAVLAASNINNITVDRDYDIERAVIPELLGGLSKQAAKLQDFFADSKGHTIFNQLELAENGIRTAWESGNDMTLQNYLNEEDGVVVEKETAALNLITAKLGDNATKFNTLWDGYKAGHYILTRDWRTETEEGDTEIGLGDAFIAGHLQKYHDALSAAGIPFDADSILDGNVGIVGFGGANDKLSSLQDKLVELGTTALEGYGVSGGKVGEMLRALVIQLGQDHEELRAFYDDISKVGLPAASKDYAVEPANTAVSELSAAPIGQQSVKLAAVNGDIERVELPAADETYHATLGEATLN